MNKLAKCKNQSNVAILTNFNDLNPGYSLTGIVVDQAHMLARHGHRVILFVNENFNPKYNDDSGLSDLMGKYPGLIEILSHSLSMDLIDYEEDELTEQHQLSSKKAGRIFADDFLLFDIDIVFTHDFVFTGWNLPYYHALIEANKILGKAKQNPFWYHWIHSVPVPQNRKPWWSLTPLGLNHFLVFPNQTEITRISEAWNISQNGIKIIPHIKDIRTWFDFGKESMALIDCCPEIMQSELIQVYPCSSDRLGAKQLDIVIKLFGHFKQIANVPVFLVIANQWATGKQPKENVQEFKALALDCGLIEYQDFVFTSELDKAWENGISKRMLRELQLLSNVFIFPTKEESFGLVGPEASFSGVFPVVNRSLTMMLEVMSPMAPAFHFGSFQHAHDLSNHPNYYESVAMSILAQMRTNPTIMTKTFCRKRYNMDSIYFKFYRHLLG